MYWLSPTDTGTGNAPIEFKKYSSNRTRSTKSRQQNRERELYLPAVQYLDYVDLMHSWLSFCRSMLANGNMLCPGHLSFLAHAEGFLRGREVSLPTDESKHSHVHCLAIPRLSTIECKLLGTGSCLAIAKDNRTADSTSIVVMCLERHCCHSE